VIEVQLLRVRDLHALLGPRRDGKDAHLERSVIHLLEQTRVAAALLVALVDLAGAFLLDDLAGHLLAVDPYAEVRDRPAARDGERVQRLDDAVLHVLENLRDFGDGHAVVDRDLDDVLLDRQLPAEAVVGHEQAGGPRRASGEEAREQRENGCDAVSVFHVNLLG
jgi:hypothetical protein